jgi:hypothetical protein
VGGFSRSPLFQSEGIYNVGGGGEGACLSDQVDKAGKSMLPVRYVVNLYYGPEVRVLPLPHAAFSRVHR